MSHVGPRGCQIAPSVSERARQTKPSAPPRLLCKGLRNWVGQAVSPAGLVFTPSDALGYLDRQWIGFHHILVVRRPIATGSSPTWRTHSCVPCRDTCSAL